MHDCVFSSFVSSASSGGITGLTTTVNGTDQPYPEYYAGFSPHTVTGNSGLSVVLPHELHHLWQSRALNDLFLLNYGLQGLNALLLKGNFVDERNYYEDFINYYPWRNTEPVWK